MVLHSGSAFLGRFFVREFPQFILALAFVAGICAPIFHSDAAKAEEESDTSDSSEGTEDGGTEDATDEDPDSTSNKKPVKIAPKIPAPERQSYYRPSRSPDRPRSDIFMPLASMILPGLDQWIEGQHVSAGIYTGLSLGSIVYVSSVAKNNGLLEKKSDKKDEANSAGDDEKEEEKEEASLSTKDLVKRKLMLGNQVYQATGGFSAYHAFRTAAFTRQSQGQYEFLTVDETPAQVLLAPFDFSYLKRKTTWIPLTVAAAIGVAIMQGPHEGFERDSFTEQDAFFTAAFSYNAGTHEEAVFRGWMMPVMMEYWHSALWANIGQSSLFALAHLGTNPLPIAQLALGYHLGYVTQRNQWTLGEAVFIHAWWDVIAFGTMWHFRETLDEEKAAMLPPPVLWLPPFEMRF